MKQRLLDKKKAIELRKQGLSYKEIMKIISVSKSSLSGWLSRNPLSDKQVALLGKRTKDRENIGRLKAISVNRINKIKREEANFLMAKYFFDQHCKDIFFITGIILYWCEGTKRSSSFSFINSDPSMVKVMNNWINTYMKPLFGKPRYRLFIHKPYQNENCEKYWLDLLDLTNDDFYKTIYKPTVHSVKKNPIYKGCIRITFTTINSLRTVLAWQKLLLSYYKGLGMHP